MLFRDAAESQKKLFFSIAARVPESEKFSGFDVNEVEIRIAGCVWFIVFPYVFEAIKTVLKYDGGSFHKVAVDGSQLADLRFSGLGLGGQEEREC